MIGLLEFLTMSMIERSILLYKTLFIPLPMSFPQTNNFWNDLKDSRFEPFSQHSPNPHTHFSSSSQFLSSYGNGYWTPGYTSYMTNPPMNWFTAKEACGIVDRFDNILIVGDSYSRHTWTALMQILSGNLVNGQLNQQSQNMMGKCDGDEAFSERDCRTAIASNINDMLFPSCSKHVHIEYNQYYASVDAPCHNWPNKFVHNRTIVINNLGVHDYVNRPYGFPQETIDCWDGLQQHILSQPSEVWPLVLGSHNVYTNRNASFYWWSERWSRQYWPINSVIQARIREYPSSSVDETSFYDELTEYDPLYVTWKTKAKFDNYTTNSKRVHRWSILDNVHLTTALPYGFSYDGAHYKQSVNLIKAQGVLNWMNSIKLKN